jgi:hypothetical protein
VLKGILMAGPALDITTTFSLLLLRRLPPATRADYLTPWTAAKAEKRFLERFATLCV